MMFRKFCSRLSLENFVIVTSMWGDFSWSVGEAHGGGLITNFFKPAIDEDTQLVRYHLVAQSSAHDIIQRITQNTRLIPGNSRQESDYEIIAHELNERIRRYRDAPEPIREGMIQALRDLDEEIRRDIEEVTVHLAKENRRMRTEMERMAALHNEARRAMEIEMRGMQEETHLEINRMAACHNEEKRRMGREITALHHGNEMRTAMETEIREMREQARSEIKLLHKQTGGILV